MGRDNLGLETIKEIKEKNLNTNFVQINENPTGRVNVSLDDKGIPYYKILDNVAWDYIEINKENISQIYKSDILYFGTLAQRNTCSKKTITKLLDESKKGTLIIYDINLRKSYYSREIIINSINRCNILKLNKEELKILTELNILKKDSDEKQLEFLIKTFDLKLIALTKGIDGSLLMTKSEKSLLPSFKLPIRDTVGAGDAFIASLAISFANKINLNQIHQNAIKTASFVCSKKGAMPKY